MASCCEKKVRDFKEAICFWKDPKNEEAIYNAKPLEKMSYKQLLLDHFDASSAEIDEWILETTGKKKAGYTSSDEKSATPAWNVKLPTSGDIPIDYYDDDALEKPLGLNMVEDDDLKKCPYKCVGKIFWFRPNSERNPDDVIYWSTAFYTGNNKIITVAHIFDLPLVSYEGKKPTFYPKDPKEAIFIPAMIDKYDIRGSHYGFYQISSIRILPDYVPRTSRSSELCQEFDITVADITSADADRNIHQELGGKCIQLRTFRREQFLTIIGYPSFRENQSCKMYKMAVYLVRDHKSSIEVAPGAPRGMSGGPWLAPTLCDEAIGIQSNTHFSASTIGQRLILRSLCSYSPKITNYLARHLHMNN